MRKHTSGRVALCGILAAMMVMVMLFGAMIPLSTYACPGLAGLLAIPVIWELGPKTGTLLFLAVSILSLFLCPDKEAALLFLFLLGWYPIARPRLQHLRRRPLRLAAKAVLFNAATLLAYGMMLFVLTMPDLQAEAADWTGPLLAAMLVLGNVTFALYDLLIARMTGFYVYQLRPKLFPSQYRPH